MTRLKRNLIRFCLPALFILAFASACTAPAVTQEPPPDDQESEQVVPIEKEMAVTADQAILRSGPGSGFDKIGNLGRGTVIVATGQTLDGDWYRIRLAEGSSGEAWISAEFTGPVEIVAGNEAEPATLLPPDTVVPSTTVVAIETPTSTSTTVMATQIATLRPTSSPPMISATTATNCRAGTSRVFEVLGFLDVGDTVEVRGRSPDGQWWYIQDPARPSRSCWVWAETTVVSGDLSQVPDVKPPPIPTLTLALPDTPTNTSTAIIPRTATLAPPDTPTPSSTVLVTGQPPATP